MPAAADISFITTCKGRLAHLQQTLGHTLAQPGTQCIVVDYNCPQGTADWVRRHHPSVQVAKALDVSQFSAARARNIGARLATTPWLCFVDADCFLSPGFVERVRPLLRDQTFLTVHPALTDLGGLVLCPKAGFDQVEGYDEAFVGWGCEDTDLYLRLRMAGLQQQKFPADWARFIAHDDALRGTFAPVADKQVSARVHGMYLQIKTDLAREDGVLQIPASDRFALFELVRQTVARDPAGAASLTLNLVNLPGVRGTDGWSLRRTRTYTFAPDEAAAPGVGTGAAPT